MLENRVQNFFQLKMLLLLLLLLLPNSCHRKATIWLGVVDGGDKRSGQVNVIPGSAEICNRNKQEETMFDGVTQTTLTFLYSYIQNSTE